VDVEQALAGSLTGKSYSVGGTLDTMTQADAKLLYDNNSAAGDAVAGWVLEMASGHEESTSTLVDFKRGGLWGVGSIRLRAADGYTVRPKITFIAGSTGLHGGGAGFEVSGINCSFTHSSGSVSFAMTSWNSIHDCVVTKDGSGSVTYAFEGYYTLTGSGSQGPAYAWNADIAGCRTKSCVSLGCTSHGATVGANYTQHLWNVIHGSSGNGLNGIDALTTVIGNVIDGNGSNGLSYSTNQGQVITNNSVTNNTGNGINWASGDTTEQLLRSRYLTVRNNNVAGNGSASNVAGSVAALDPGLQTDADPYTDRGSDDFTILDNALKAAAHLDKEYPLLGQRSHVDIGAFQREESGGGGSSIRKAPFAGGISG